MRPALSVTSEMVPLVKTGGLADVAGALPGALAPEGWDLRTILPGYPGVLKATGKGRIVLKDENLFGGSASLRQVKVGDHTVYVIDAPHLYDRDGGPYNQPSGADWPDNPFRFAALGRMAARIGRDGIGKWRPEVVHVHDWQGGLAPLYLSQGDGPRPGTILTIHNMAFHGMAPASARGAMGLPEGGFGPEGYEFWGNISTLKAGIVWADKITTVSPSYARELVTPEFGAGLDGLLRYRSADLSGILNGIDTEVWNPETDPGIVNFKKPSGKKKAKAALREELGLPDADGPLCVVISRLSDQKGLDLLLDALPALVDRGGQLALLGSGDRTLEARFRNAAVHPNIAVTIGYDEGLSHRMIAGGDAIIVPSRFEPCGLTQLYGLRYGTIPIVAYTGGLIDTVVPTTPAAMRAGASTGIQFHPATAHALAGALMHAVTLFADRKSWTQLQKNAMRTPVGWDASAPAYAALYDEVARR